MNQYTLVFSPTGGTKRVVDLLASDLAPDSITVDLSLPNTDYSRYSFAADEFCLIGVPSYGGRVPAAAVANLRQVRSDGARAVLVVTFGNRAYDDTLLELRNEVQAIGFKPIAAVAAVAEHSIVRQYGAGRPDQRDKKNLQSFSLKIRGLMGHGGTSFRLAVPGHLPYKRHLKMPFIPVADKNCTLCSTCPKFCPVGAIPKLNPSLADKHLCISCMRCIIVCPNGARTVHPIFKLIATLQLKRKCTQRKPNELYLAEYD